MIFLGGTSGFHYGQVVLQIHLSVGQVDFSTKFDPCLHRCFMVILTSQGVGMSPCRSSNLGLYNGSSSVKTRTSHES